MDKSRLILACISTLILAACSKEATVDELSEPVVVTIYQSTVARELNPNISDEQFKALNAGNNQFAWDLYGQLGADSAGKNVFFSPYSLSTALAMTYAGALGNTKTEMADALHFDLEDDVLHAGFNKLSKVMDSRQLPEDGTTPPLTLNINNTLWPATTWLGGMSSQFLDTLSKNYGSGLHALNYALDPEACRVEINDAVYDWTNNRIEDLIPEGELTVDTAFVITNTIYMNAPWAKLFNEHSTRKADFTNYDGTVSSVDMMQYGLDSPMRYSADLGVQALAIPYRGNDLEMVVFLPDSGTFDAFEQSLSQERMAKLTEALAFTSGNVVLKFPKFKMDFGKSLIKPMTALGMKDAFNYEVADFGLIGHPIAITGINHKAFIEVTEHGTESSAATSVSGSSGAAQPNVVDFTVDRPFVFIIHDRTTGNILFAGRMLTFANPT